VNDGVILMDFRPGFMWSTTILLRVFGTVRRPAANDAEWY